MVYGRHFTPGVRPFVEIKRPKTCRIEAIPDQWETTETRGPKTDLGITKSRSDSGAGGDGKQLFRVGWGS